MADGKIVIDVIMDDGDIKKGVANIDGVAKASERAGMSLKNMVGAGIVIKGVSAAMGVLKSSVGDAIKRFDTLNNSTRVFQNMGFSASETKKTMDTLKSSLQGLPTPLDSAVKSVQLLASSTGDLGKSEEIFSALNNGILGFGGTTEQVENAVIQLSQAFSNGKVDAETWNSMINSGLGPALSALAKEMGKTTGELKSGLSDGSISVADFQERLIKLNKEGGGGLKSLEQIAKDAMGGIGTGIANMKTAITRGVANMIGKLDELVKALTGKSIGENITAISSTIDKAFESIVKSMDAVVPIIESVKKAFKGLDEVKNIGAFSWLQNSIKWVSFYMNDLALQLKDRTESIVQSFQTALTRINPIITKLSAIISGWSIAISAVLSYAIPLAVDLMMAVFEGMQSFILPLLDSVVSKVWDFSSIITEAILTYVVPALQNMIDWVKDNKGIMEEFGKLLGAVAVGFAVFKTLSTVVTVFNTVKTAILGISTAFKALTIVMAANPFTLILIAISALVAAFVYLWQTNEGFKNAVIAIWTAISEFLNPVIAGIVEFITATWGVLVEWWNTNQQSMSDTVSTVWNAIKGVFDVVMEAISLVVTTILTNIKTFWDTWGASIMAVVQVIWAYISAVFQNTLANIMAVVSVVFNQIGNVITLVMNVIQNIIKVALSLIKGDWQGVLDGIKGIVGAFGTYIQNTFNNIMTFGKNIVNNGINAIKGFFSSLGDIDLLAAGKAIIDGFVKGLKDAWESGMEFIGGIGDWIKEHKGPISYDMRLLIPAGKAIMGGFNDSLENSFKNVQKNVSSMAGRLANEMDLGSSTLAVQGGFSLPVVTAESALGIGQRMSTGSNNVSNYYTTNNNHDNSDNGNQTTIFEATIEMEGKTIGKGVAKYVNPEINRINKRTARVRGDLI